MILFASRVGEVEIWLEDGLGNREGIGSCRGRTSMLLYRTVTVYVGPDCRSHATSKVQPGL